MATISLGTKTLLDTGADALALFVEQGTGYTGVLKAVGDALSVDVQAVIKKHEFSGKALSTCAISGMLNGAVVECIIVGLGKKNKSGVIELETYRRALGRAVRSAEGRKAHSLACSMPSASLFGVSERVLAYNAATIAAMATYHFDEFITDKDGKKNNKIAVTLVAETAHADHVAGVNDGSIVAQSVNNSRLWIDMPPSHLTPTQLANKAQAIVDAHDNLSITVFDEEEATQMGMGGLTGVSRGSDQDCQLVIIEYKCGDKNAPTLGFVGKGITFDSGGLSLKPPAYMETMKEDMSGASAVISTMDAIAKLKPKVNIVALAPLSENLPSGKATKPGDILTFYNGKTAEVKNTDAEGRLVLADALSYAVKNYKLDALIDLATLTGACAYALGPFFTGMMSQHPEFQEKVQQASERSGDRVWALPFHDDYKVAIKSPVADISNIGSKRYMAGAVTAGFFLQNFVEDVPWVHLDIAGTAFNVPDISYYRNESATGVGVRLLVDLAMNWQ